MKIIGQNVRIGVEHFRQNKKHNYLQSPSDEWVWVFDIYYFFYNKFCRTNTCRGCTIALIGCTPHEVYLKHVKSKLILHNVMV